MFLSLNIKSALCECFEYLIEQHLQTSHAGSPTYKQLYNQISLISFIAVSDYTDQPQQ